MDTNLIVVALLTAVFIIVIYALWRSRSLAQLLLDDVQAKLRQQEAMCADAVARAESAETRGAADIATHELYRTHSQERINMLIEERTKAQVAAETLAAQLQQERDQLEKVKAEMKTEFENVANKIFEEKSRHFRRTSSESLESLLNPFRENINDFRQNVDKINSEQILARGQMINQINSLMELNRSITQETTNLTNALKGSSKVQGDWGEMILERILEGSGLTKGLHYTVQENLKDEHGNNQRPDIIIRLPEERCIVVDSKVSLRAFVEYSAAQTSDKQEAELKRHIAAVKAHVAELNARNYQGAGALNSPDYVVMFIPNEPAFVSAMMGDPSLWAEAHAKKVIISTPANLSALMMMVGHLWRTDNQNRNALNIAAEGGKLYDKFMGFLDKFSAIGRGLEMASRNYDDAFRQLKTGTGNLISRTEKLREMGVKASKSLPQQMADFDTDEGAQELD